MVTPFNTQTQHCATTASHQAIVQGIPPWIQPAASSTEASSERLPGGHAHSDPCHQGRT